jgi:acyl-CoA thioesterase
VKNCDQSWPPREAGSESSATVSTASAFRDRVPFLKDLGVEIVGAHAGRSRLELTILPRHLNAWSAVHGGVLMTLLDVAMAAAGRSLDLTAGGGITVEMTTSFMQAAPSTGRLIATGLCAHQSSTMAFCEAEIRDQTDRLLARAMGIFKYVRERPLEPPEPVC